MALFIVSTIEKAYKKISFSQDLRRDFIEKGLNAVKIPIGDTVRVKNSGLYYVVNSRKFTL